MYSRAQMGIRAQRANRLGFSADVLTGIVLIGGDSSVRDELIGLMLLNLLFSHRVGEGQDLLFVE